MSNNLKYLSRNNNKHIFSSQDNYRAITVSFHFVWLSYVPHLMKWNKSSQVSQDNYIDKTIFTCKKACCMGHAILIFLFGILLTRETHVHDRIILLRMDVWAHKKPVKWALMYLCVRSIEFVSLCDFSIGFLELFSSFSFSRATRVAIIVSIFKCPI